MPAVVIQGPGPDDGFVITARLTQIGQVQTLAIAERTALQDCQLSFRSGQ
jgi:hypothetical protein